MILLHSLFVEPNKVTYYISLISIILFLIEFQSMTSTHDDYSLSLN